MIDAAHWLHPARHLPSPNADERPQPNDIALLVIHAIALPPEQFGGPWIDALFANQLDCDAHPYFASLRGLRVSAHLCIRRDGDVSQYVAFDRRAWHAGVSSWQGRSRCNDFSIGIELEGSEQMPFTPQQYLALAGISGCLLQRYPRLNPQTIVGHADIAPGRKTDPGPYFDWAYYASLIE